MDALRCGAPIGLAKSDEGPAFDQGAMGANFALARLSVPPHNERMAASKSKVRFDIVETKDGQWSCACHAPRGWAIADRRLQDRIRSSKVDQGAICCLAQNVRGRQVCLRRPGAPGLSSGSTGKIEPHAAVAILDLDDPKIGIKRDLALKPLVGLAGRDPFRLVRPDEGSFDAPLRFNRHRLRGRLVQGGTPVETVNLDEDRARLRRAPAAEHRALAFRAASAQIGRDPYVRPQAHRFSARSFARPRRAASPAVA